MNPVLFGENAPGGENPPAPRATLFVQSDGVTFPSPLWYSNGDGTWSQISEFLIPFPLDIIIKKAFPSLQLVGTEVGAGFGEYVEVDNAIYSTFNAKFNGASWIPQSLTDPAFAIKIDDNGVSILGCASGTNPIVWTTLSTQSLTQLTLHTPVVGTNATFSSISVSNLSVGTIAVQNISASVGIFQQVYAQSVYATTVNASIGNFIDVNAQLGTFTSIEARYVDASTGNFQTIDATNLNLGTISVTANSLIGLATAGSSGAIQLGPFLDQWGTNSTIPTNGAATAVAFTFPFPNSCFNVEATILDTTSDQLSAPRIDPASITRLGFNVSVTGGSGANTEISYRAIGD